MHPGSQDVESANSEYKPYEQGSEHEALLPTSNKDADASGLADHRHNPPTPSGRRFGAIHLSLAFLAGILACFLGQFAICGPNCFSRSPDTSVADTGSTVGILASPDAGSTERHNFPPNSPTNVFPSLFPTDIGYAGSTPTGAEPNVIETAPAYPIHSGAAHLVAPDTLGDTKQPSKGFDIFKSWGNLSPWYSVDRKAFGLDSGPQTPPTCRVTGLHFLHRHGARYPTAWAAYGGPANFSTRLHNAAPHWTTSGDLEFMNDWTYKLGEEVLTPFGRQQLYDLGVSMRMKYGSLLKGFTETNTIPVFRTESQDRMLASAMNFAIGFFGYPFEGQYQQSITIEADGFNNTLAPYKTCPNARDHSRSERGFYYVKNWAARYLKNAQARFQSQMQGFELTIEDVYVMQQNCAYETVALGYSKFCELFTQEEWEGFDYALDLSFWYNDAFGSPVARIQGVGWVQELLARLTHTPIKDHKFSTNSTFHNPVTFPLNQTLYVDATHEVVILNIITALNLTRFAEDGPLPDDHIPPNRKFRVSELAPFAANMQFQLLECDALPDTQIRIIINDGVAPLTGIKGCPEQKDGMCPLPVFVAAQQELVESADWVYACYGGWEVPEGPAWNTTTGDPPK